MRTIVLVIAACALSACATPRALPGTQGVLAPATPDDGRVHVAVAPYARVGPVSGSIQIPRGGAPGSTSLRRPTLSEIGVTDAWEAGARVNVDYGRHRLFLQGHEHLLSGDATLGTDLVSQNSLFPAGTVVDSSSSLTMLRAGYSHLFEVPLGPCDRVRLRPGVGARFVVVHYRLDGSNGGRTSRHYGTNAPELSLEASWRPRDRGRLVFEAEASRTIEAFFASDLRRMKVFELAGRARYDLSPAASVFLETGYREVLTRDDQPQVQNRVEVDFGPWIGIGGEFRF